MIATSPQNKPDYEGKVYNVDFAKDGTLTLTDTDRITARNGEDKIYIDGLGKKRTAQNVAVMPFAQSIGIPTAFIEQVDDVTVRCQNVEMLKSEFIIRRYATGSYEELDPDTYKGVPKYDLNARYQDPLVFQIFAKETLDLRDPDNPKWVDGNSIPKELLKADGIYHDPYVDISADGTWDVYKAGTPLTAENLLLANAEPRFDPAYTSQVEMYSRMLFEELEQALSEAMVGNDLGISLLYLVDFKLEFGVTADGELVLADVFTLDNQRSWMADAHGTFSDLSKQVFRDICKALPEDVNIATLPKEERQKFDTEVLELYQFGTQVFQCLNAE